MAKADNPLDATTQLLQEHAIAFVVERASSKHYRIRATGLPLIFCSATASDYRAVANAVSLARRLIRSVTQ